MSVWKSDEKLLIFASLICPSKIILFEKCYQAFDQCFITRWTEHLEVCQKYILRCAWYFQLLSYKANEIFSVKFVEQKSYYSNYFKKSSK